ncbi:uncharacterized protein LOC123365148 [Mauremys mutica]|uniref:uncharacterized protein LOC123365148 n=1 Tax=Mauremys mutica TaxID=74926 RepID=UPI001D160B06|nr:uncharacterized protein LOC123365148 [Mauremys mutica]
MSHGCNQCPHGPCAHGPAGSCSWACGQHTGMWEWDHSVCPAADSRTRGPEGACWGWEGAKPSPPPATGVSPPGGRPYPGDTLSCSAAQGRHLQPGQAHCGCCSWRAGGGRIERDTCWAKVWPSLTRPQVPRQQEAAAVDSDGRGAKPCPCQAALPCGLGAPSRSADSLDSCGFSTATSSLSTPSLCEGKARADERALASAPDLGGSAEETISSMLGCCAISPGAAALPLGIDRSPTSNSTAAQLLEEFLTQKARARDPAALPASTDGGSPPGQGDVLHRACCPSHPTASTSLQQLWHHNHRFQQAMARFESGTEACGWQSELGRLPARETRQAWGAGGTQHCSHSGEAMRAEPRPPHRSMAWDSAVCDARGPPFHATGLPTGHGCCATVEVVGRRPRQDQGRGWSSAFHYCCRKPCSDRASPRPAWEPQRDGRGTQATRGSHREMGGTREWIETCPSDLPATHLSHHTVQAALRRAHSSHSTLCLHAHNTGSWASTSCSDHTPGSPCQATSRAATRPRPGDCYAPLWPGRSCPWEPEPMMTPQTPQPQPGPRKLSCSDTDPAESPEDDCTCTYCMKRCQPGRCPGAWSQSHPALGGDEQDSEHGCEREPRREQGWDRGMDGDQGRGRENRVWLIAKTFERRAQREAERAKRERRAQEHRALRAPGSLGREPRGPRGRSQEPKRGTAQVKDSRLQTPPSRAVARAHPLGPPHPRREARAQWRDGHLSSWL